MVKSSPVRTTGPAASTSGSAGSSLANARIIDILAAIDGTGSKKWLDKEKENSHTLRFKNHLLSPKDDKEYFHGPNDAGFNVGRITENAFNFVLKRLQVAVEARLKGMPGNAQLKLADLRIRVNLVGHSRGGLIAILVARKLAAHRLSSQLPTLHVHFLGLYDAVDRHLGPSGKEIPNNVVAAYHALRDSTAGSRPTFGNCGTNWNSPTRYVEQKFIATHSGVGGDPWKGDQPKQINEHIDINGSEKVGRWMRDAAEKEGLVFFGGP